MSHSVAVYGDIPHCFLPRQITALRRCTILHSSQCPTEGHLGCVQFFAITNGIDILNIPVITATFALLYLLMCLIWLQIWNWILMLPSLYKIQWCFLLWFIPVLGNKIDLAERREVSQQRAEEFSEAQDMYYLETSAKESDNVEKLFLDLACRLISEARQNTLVNNVSSPLPGEGKSISYLTCCNFN